MSGRLAVLGAAGFILLGNLFAAEPQVVPGTTLTLAFPHLPRMHDDLPAACEVHIPKDYDAGTPVPLLVWFSGGKGSQHVAGANGLVNFDRFVVVALPYPGGRDMRAFIKEGGVDDVWAFQQSMLSKVRELIPNIDVRVRIAAGTSNGAHLIGTGLNRDWAGFVDYFSLFVLHEGGAAPTYSYSAAKNKRLLVVWGEDSEALKWQLWFNARIGQSDARISYHSVPGAGHGLTARGRDVIRAWIDEAITLVPAR